MALWPSSGTLRWWQTRCCCSSLCGSFTSRVSCFLGFIGIHVLCHSSPLCAFRGARFRCCIVGLGAAARFRHAVVRLDFVVLGPVELLLSRSVAVEPLLVTLVAILGLKKQNLPLRLRGVFYADGEEAWCMTFSSAVWAPLPLRGGL